MAGSDDQRGMKSRPLALDASARSADPDVPAFLARPKGEPVYHGFPVVEGVEVEGFRLGMIADLESSPEDGDAFVIAPDGSRAGLVWCVGDVAGLEEVCRWKPHAGACGPLRFPNRWRPRKRCSAIWSQWCQSPGRSGAVGGKSTRSSPSVAGLAFGAPSGRLVKAPS